MYLLAQKWHTTFQFQKTQISNSYLSKFETSKIHSKSTFTTKFLNYGKKAHQHSTMISGMKITIHICSVYLECQFQQSSVFVYFNILNEESKQMHY